MSVDNEEGTIGCDDDLDCTIVTEKVLRLGDVPREAFMHLVGDLCVADSSLCWLDVGGFHLTGCTLLRPTMAPAASAFDENCGEVL